MMRAMHATPLPLKFVVLRKLRILSARLPKPDCLKRWRFEPATVEEEQETDHDADIAAVLEVVGGHGAELSVGMAAAQQQELAAQLCRPIHCMPYQVDALHAPFLYHPSVEAQIFLHTTPVVSSGGQAWPMPHSRFPRPSYADSLTSRRSGTRPCVRKLSNEGAKYTRQIATFPFNSSFA